VSHEASALGPKQYVAPCEAHPVATRAMEGPAAKRARIEPSGTGSPCITSLSQHEASHDKQAADDPDADLGPEQRAAVAMVLQRYNVLITGGAGVGKSHVTERLVKRLRDMNIKVHNNSLLSTWYLAVCTHGEFHDGSHDCNLRMGFTQSTCAA
jgi:hypothetical protein